MSRNQRSLFERMVRIMIEVLFGESEAASMKVAKNTVVAGKTEGPISVWIAGKKEPPKKGEWIEGTPDEVICLGFMMDIGNIKENVDSEYRKNLIYSMYAQDQWGGNEDVELELQKMGDFYCNELQRLQEYLAEGEPIRVWYSDAPYSMCGFYYLCSILQKYENEIHTVKLTKYRIGSQKLVFCQNWGDVAAEEFAGFLTYEQELSREEIRVNSILWSELREDNSPLRAVVNGKVLGVPEDFYDFLIWKNITKKPIKEARLIGNLLGKNQISISDLWYAKRIDFFIQQGKIAVIEDSENKYARTICLV